MKSYALLASVCSAIPGAFATAGAVDVQDLLKRSVAATQRDWKEAPNFTFTERDIEEKLDSQGRLKSKAVKTYEVTMMDGSPYRRLLKLDEKALSPRHQKAEEAKMEAERQRRQRQSRGERAKRIARYEKERTQDQAMLHEMTEALTYKLIGEETVNGRASYVLEATPKPGYVPKMRDTKVLTGMKGKLWIDKADTQWVKVEAEVVRSISFYAVATVSPGTKFILEQEPVGGGIWLPKHFAVKVNSSLLWMARNSSGDETYADYRRVTGESPRGKTAETAGR